MRFQVCFRSAVIATVSAGLLAGCSGRGSLPATGTAASLNSPSTSRATSPDVAKNPRNLYVADLANNEVDVYRIKLVKSKKGKPGSKIQTVTLTNRLTVNDPAGLATDTQGNLYVGAEDGVEVFAPGQTTPKLTLALPPNTSYPNIDSVSVNHNGEVAAFISGAFGNVVSLYTSGQTNPSTTITTCSSSDNFGSGDGSVALDQAGDVYVSGSYSAAGTPTGYLVEVPNGSSQCVNTGIQTEISGKVPMVPIIFDAAGDLLLGGNNITVYPNGKPPASTTIAVAATGIAFMRSNERLWVTNFKGSSSAAAEYTFPGGKSRSTAFIPGGSQPGFPAGIAVFPPSP